jgi:HSP20 family protein
MEPSFKNGQKNDSLFRNFFDAENLSPANWLNAFDTTSPSINISEHNNCFCIDIIAPDFKKENFIISIENDILTINACLQSAGNKPGIDVEAYKQLYNAFTRSFNLPSNITQDRITAVYKNGTLKVHIPKYIPSGKKEVPVE